MGQKPDNVCKLEKGKMIDANEGFVDTFNWMVDFICNLKGDKDENPESGTLSVDRTVSDFPVIRSGEADESEGKAGEITVVGTDGTTAVCKTGKITFASATNASVVVTPSADADGNVTVTVGVYYA